MNTIDFDENRKFCEEMSNLLAHEKFKTFECLLADNGHSLTDYLNLMIDALMPQPDLSGYFWAVQNYARTGEIT